MTWYDACSGLAAKRVACAMFALQVAEARGGGADRIGAAWQSPKAHSIELDGERIILFGADLRHPSTVVLAHCRF